MNNKQIRRLKRHVKNSEKQYNQQQTDWNSGKLLKENKNSGPYSVLYTLELCQRLYLILQKYSKTSNFIDWFRKYKVRVIDLILNWNPSADKNLEYGILKHTLETYWDEPEKLGEIKFPDIKLKDYGYQGPSNPDIPKKYQDKLNSIQS